MAQTLELLFMYIFEDCLTEKNCEATAGYVTAHCGGWQHEARPQSPRDGGGNGWCPPDWREGCDGRGDSRK